MAADDAQCAHDDAGVARLVGDALGLVARGLGHAAAQQPLGAVDALGQRQRRHRRAQTREHGEPVGGGLFIARRRRQHAQLPVGERGHIELTARLRRLAKQVQRFGDLGDVGITLEQSPEGRLRAVVVAGARREHRRLHERARREPAIGIAIGDAERRRPCTAPVLVAGQRVGQEPAHVVADGTRLRRLRRERLHQRRLVALLERSHRARPRALDLGVGAARRRPQHERGDGQRQQHARPARLGAHHAPREHDPLHRGDVGHDREHPEGGLHDVEDRAGDQTNQPLRPLHHSDGALHADRLRARFRVGHHDGAGEAGHREQRATRIRHARVEHDDAEHHGDVGVAVDHRIEERAERRHLTRGASKRAVEQIE